jgi:hypothetical protein
MWYVVFWLLPVALFIVMWASYGLLYTIGFFIVTQIVVTIAFGIAIYMCVKIYEWRK